MPTDTETNRVRVSDIISDKNIRSWRPGEIIVVKAGCDSGKSYFVKNKLYDYAKSNNFKILILLHRKPCIDQFTQELMSAGKAEVICVKSYQWLEYQLLHNHTEPDLSQYKYIVCDEFHYFLDDSRFSNQTDLSFHYIMRQRKTIRIFMSATSGITEELIRSNTKRKLVEYEIKPDFTYIQSLNYYMRDDTVEELINQFIKTGEKAMFFLQSCDAAYQLYSKYHEYCTFLCSKNNTVYYKHVEQGKINAMLRNERFESQFLIATETFDSGCNIYDENIKYIVIDISDVDVLVQCIGRKRYRLDTDKINLYIKAITNQQIGGFQKKTKDKIKMAEDLLNTDTKTFLDKYPRQNDREGIIYDEPYNSRPNQSTKKVNMLMLIKRQYDLSVYQDMISLGNFGYCKYIARVFGFYNTEANKYNYSLLNSEYDLTSYLESNTGTVWLSNVDRKDLIDKINARSNGKQLKRLDSLNSVLEERNVPYRIVEYATSRYNKETKNKKNYCHAWKLEKVS